MGLSDDEKREAYKQWIKNKCNNEFIDDEGKESLPLDVKLALDKLIKMDNNKEVGISGKTKGRVSIKFSEGIPRFIMDLISNHRKLKW